jgi:hypothetical protein
MPSRAQVLWRAGRREYYADRSPPFWIAETRRSDQTLLDVFSRMRWSGYTYRHRQLVGFSGYFHRHENSALVARLAITENGVSFHMRHRWRGWNAAGGVLPQ